jgi:type IV pilus assembly protein PilP
MAGQMHWSVLIARWFLLGCVGFLLTSCQGSDLGQLLGSVTQERTLADLEALKREQEVAPGRKPDPLPKIPHVEPFQYSAGSLSDPFSRDNVDRPWETRTQVVLADDKEEDLRPDPLAPDLTRERQPLEEFPLDSMTFVGVLVALGETRGILLSQGTGLTHEVKVGDYVGQDYGQIGDIDLDTGIMVINEVKLDVSGRWQQNEETLSLPGAAVD